MLIMGSSLLMLVLVLNMGGSTIIFIQVCKLLLRGCAKSVVVLKLVILLFTKFGSIGLGCKLTGDCERLCSKLFTGEIGTRGCVHT